MLLVYNKLFNVMDCILHTCIFTLIVTVSDEEAIISFLWQLVRVYYLKDISVHKYPELVSLNVTIPKNCHYNNCLLCRFYFLMMTKICPTYCLCLRMM